MLRDALWRTLWVGADKADAAAAALTAINSPPSSIIPSDIIIAGGGGGGSNSVDPWVGHGPLHIRRDMCQAGGRLYCQLYDRACRRPFAPTEAFHAPGLSGEMFTQVSPPCYLSLAGGGSILMSQPYLKALFSSPLPSSSSLIPAHPLTPRRPTPSAS